MNPCLGVDTREEVRGFVILYSEICTHSLQQKQKLQQNSFQFLYSLCRPCSLWRMLLWKAIFKPPVINLPHGPGQCIAEDIAVGVGYGFPTHVPMSQGNAFHQGWYNIPDVTLVGELESFYEDFSRMIDEILSCSGHKVTMDPRKVSTYAGYSLHLCFVLWFTLTIGQAIE